MRFTIIIFLIFFLLILQVNCTDNSKNTFFNQSKLKDSLKTVSNKLKPKHIDTLKVVTKEQILGIWIALDKEYLTVEIDKHSFNYCKHKERLKYIFIKDTISIFHFNNKFGGRPYYVNDTLLLLNKNDYCLKFIRQKK